MRKAYLLLALLLIISALSACAGNETTAESETDVQSFNFSIGGFGAYDEYTIDSTSLKLKIVLTEMDGTTAGNSEYQWDQEKWDMFIQEVLACGVTEWESDYTDPDVYDGTQWVLNMKGGISSSVTGSNAYPPQWDDFIKVLNKYFNTTILYANPI